MFYFLIAYPKAEANSHLIISISSKGTFGEYYKPILIKSLFVIVGMVLNKIWQKTDLF